ncbi:MAG: hypothetical protein ACSLE1_19505 [Sphingobium sp.]
MAQNLEESTDLDRQNFQGVMDPGTILNTPVRFFTIAALAAFALSRIFSQSINITAFYLERQDRWLLLLGTTGVLLCGWRLKPHTRIPALNVQAMLAAAAVLLVVTFLGHSLILSGYDRTRDEQMASFDALVFASGHLVESLPTLWRNHADVLNLNFMYPADQRGAWISAYLPFNAGFRALLASIATPVLAGPFMTGLGAIALWGCVRRLWPHDKQAGTVALILYGGSAQILVTGMTSYAMPAHLTLNMFWLWLFLRGSWKWDLAALFVGFLAVGLHQPLMHPMFAAPILFLLVREKRWDRATIYLVGYAIVGAFWLWWPTFVWQMVQADPSALPPVGVDFTTRMTRVIATGDPFALPNMLSNILRLIAWQHLLLLPLMLIGAKAARSNSLAGGLTGGIILTIFMMAVLLPYQGHGFGYRYVHGLIGNAILLAIFGWRIVVESEAAGKLRNLMFRTTIVGVFVLVPVQGWMAFAFYAPPAQVSGRIDKVDADYAVIGAGDARDAYDLIYNPPALDRRPVRLLREALDVKTIRDICAESPTVALVGNTILQPLADFYEDRRRTADQANAQIIPRLAEAGCRILASGWDQGDVSVKPTRFGMTPEPSASELPETH